MDRVTASGTIFIADSTALASGFGSDPGFSDTNTASSINPEDATANASGLATAPDGSQVSVTAVIAGESGAGSSGVLASGDTLTSDSSVIAATADGAVHQGDTSASGYGEAQTHGGDGLSLSSGEFFSTAGDQNAGGTATSGGFSTDGTSGSASGFTYQSGEDGLHLGTGTSASGNTDGFAEAIAQSGLAQGTIIINSGSVGDAVGPQSSAQARQVMKIGENGIIVRSIGSATSSLGDGALSDSSITVEGISPDSVDQVTSTFRLNGISRSTSTAIINLP